MAVKSVMGWFRDEDFFREDTDALFVCEKQDALDRLVEFKKEFCDKHMPSDLQWHIIADVCTERHRPKPWGGKFVCGCDCHENLEAPPEAC